MRQIQLAPGGIVEGNLFRASGISFKKRPAGVEIIRYPLGRYGQWQEA